jgi:1,2-diacylglycerol 3-alpha-glucosyltransferase
VVLAQSCYNTNRIYPFKGFITMRIAFFTDAYPPQINGVATTVEELRGSLVARDHKVYVVVPSYPKFKDTCPDVLRLKSVKLWRNPELRVSYMFPDKILQKVLMLDVDIVHGFSGGATPSLGLTLAKLKRKPYVFTYNTRWNKYTHYILKGKVIKPKAVEQMVKLYCNVCDHIIAPAQYVKDELISFGVKKPITVIPNGVNINKFKPVKNNELREKLGLSEDDQLVLCVARLAKEKSLDFLIKTFAKYVKDNPNAYFVIAGDGPERANLQKLIDSLGISNKVILLGMIPYNEIPKIYNGADIFIFASQTETEGMIVPEAMASGLPVLAVRDRVFEQFIESGSDGFLVEKNEEVFNAHLDKLLRDDNLRLQMGKNARAKAEQFSLDEVAKKFENLYKQIA